MRLRKLTRFVGWIALLALVIRVIDLAPQWVVGVGAIWILLLMLGGKDAA